MMAEMTPMMVACPPGAAPGSMVMVTTPAGQKVQVQVPAGVTEGTQFQVMLPGQGSAGDFDGKYNLQSPLTICCETMPATVTGTGSGNVIVTTEPSTCCLICSGTCLGNTGRTVR